MSQVILNRDLPKVLMDLFVDRCSVYKYLDLDVSKTHGKYAVMSAVTKRLDSLNHHNPNSLVYVYEIPRNPGDATIDKSGDSIYISNEKVLCFSTASSCSNLLENFQGDSDHLYGIATYSRAEGFECMVQ